MSEFDKYICKRERFRITSNSYQEKARGRQALYSTNDRGSSLGQEKKIKNIYVFNRKRDSIVF